MLVNSVGTYLLQYLFKKKYGFNRKYNYALLITYLRFWSIYKTYKYTHVQYDTFLAII